jgi:mono/diheme cytochrome c family protein
MTDVRHPGESRDLVRRGWTFPNKVPAFAGMTALLVLASAAIAQGPPPAPKPETLNSRPGATGGEAQYLQHCAMCHGPNGMGTGLLARRTQPALLEAREKLPAAYVILAARQGVGNMPAIARGEVNDADLTLIADYLAAGPHPAKPGVAK